MVTEQLVTDLLIVAAVSALTSNVAVTLSSSVAVGVNTATDACTNVS